MNISMQRIRPSLGSYSSKYYNFNIDIFAKSKYSKKRVERGTKDNNDMSYYTGSRQLLLSYVG
jgi:hypothetical protein